MTPEQRDQMLADLCDASVVNLDIWENDDKVAHGRAILDQLEKAGYTLAPLATAEPGEDGLRAALISWPKNDDDPLDWLREAAHGFYDAKFGAADRIWIDDRIAALRAPIADAGLDACTYCGSRDRWLHYYTCGMYYGGASLGRPTTPDAVEPFRAAPVADEGLDVERLGEAIFRVGTGYRQRETAAIPARIANSQDGARASGEFAEAIAAEYARVTPTPTVDVDVTVNDQNVVVVSPGERKTETGS